MRLEDLGWDDWFATRHAALAGPEDVPGRVVIEFNHIFRVMTATGEVEASTSGRMRHRAERRSELPAVGDWVIVRHRPGEARTIIQAVLPRRSWFSRKVAGHLTDEQVVAANVDVVFLVMALDADFNLRRLERYLLLGRESGAAPVVLLTKPDVCPDVPALAARASSLAGGLPVHVVSPRHREGLHHVADSLARGRTGALLGSSGVGKSTLINQLVGVDVQKTREVRGVDSKGRHTTSHRELIVLPDGGLVIDTPGMRELQLWDVAGAVGVTFGDIESLALTCHFSNCRHRNEPRCAVKVAVAKGGLAQARLDSYLKLQVELALLAKQQDERQQIEDRRRGRGTGRPLGAPDRAKGR